MGYENNTANGVEKVGWTSIPSHPDLIGINFCLGYAFIINILMIFSVAQTLAYGRMEITYPKRALMPGRVFWNFSNEK